MKTNDTREIQMIDAIINKDMIGLKLLYNLYAPKLFGLICQVLNDEHQQQRALSKTIASIWETANLYDRTVECPFIWMLKIVQKSISEELYEKTSDLEIGQVKNIELLDVLGTDKFFVFTRAYFLGLKLDVIADSLNITITEVKKLLSTSISDVTNFYALRNT